MSGTMGGLGGMGGGGGGIDASIPLKAGQGVPQPENPLTMLGKFGQVQNLLNQNALFPIHKQTAETELNQKNLGYAMATHQALLGLIGSHLTDDDTTPIDPKSIISGTVAMSDSLNAAYQDRPPITAAQMTKGLALIPMPPAGTDWRDPKYQEQLRGKLKNILANTLPAAQSIAMRMGQYHAQTTGSEILPGQVGGLLSAQPNTWSPTGPRIGQTPSPEFLAAPQTRTDETGQTTTAPGATFTPQGLLPQHMQQPPSSGAGPMGNGRYPGAPTTNAPQAVPGAGGAPVAGPPPGQASGQLKDVEYFKSDQQGIPARETATQSLEKALQALNITNSGVGTERLNRMKSFIQSMTPSELNSLGIKPFEIATMNYDIAHKYLIDYARSQGAAGGTNLQLQTSQEANPSTGISNPAAIDIIKTNIGRERQNIAKTLGAPDPNGIGYGKHAAEFAGATDPRAFAFDMYTPAERKKILTEVDKSPISREKFEKSLALAVRLKLVKPDRGASNAQ